jgi:hypothetical protein
MRTKRDKQGVMLIASVAIVVLGLLAYRGYIGYRPKPGPDNCLGKPVASTAIIIDRSETTTQQTLNEIRARAMSYVRDSVKINERVSVFSVDDLAKEALVPLVSLCRPRRDGNRLVENVPMLEKQFRIKFEAPVDTTLTPRQGTSTESPLAQAITDISLSRYLRSDRNTLLVFSDMLENTNRFSLYRCASPTRVIDDFRRSRTGAMERPRFRNTMVRLNIIPRLDQSKTTLECRDKLWVWFFGDNPGPDAGLELDYLPGGPAVQPRIVSGRP